MGVVRWILPLGVMAVGVLSGAALAGRPTASPTISISGTSTVATAPTTTISVATSSTTNSSTPTSQVTTTLPDRAAVTVLVVNGTARPGLASRGATVTVVTADRMLRARAGAWGQTLSPGWLLDQL